MFTLAHSITLSLAVLGVVHAPSALVEPLIAASIIWVAAENILAERRLWRRLAVTFGFGLVHGLGFADALSPLALAGWSLVGALAGFNLGVELGQGIAIALVLPVMLGIGRLARATLVYRCASLAVAMAGAYWLIERVTATDVHRHHTDPAREWRTGGSAHLTGPARPATPPSPTAATPPPPCPPPPAVEG